VRDQRLESLVRTLIDHLAALDDLPPGRRHRSPADRRAEVGPRRRRGVVSQLCRRRCGGYVKRGHLLPLRL